jgi:hypothetical protein
MKNDRLTQLKQLLADELKSNKPGLLYIDDLKLSIAREEQNKIQFQMVK